MGCVEIYEGCMSFSSSKRSQVIRGQDKLTATSTVFSWPTKLMSEVQVLRVITAAMNTKPLLLVALEAVI